MNETSDLSLSTLQLELENITRHESPSQQSPKQEELGRKYTKEDKCLICSGTVRRTSSRENKKGQIIDYYSYDCTRCHAFKRSFGLNSIEVDWMYFLQEGNCANPGCNEKAGHLDHCHKTDKLRDILCPKCNQALGSLNEDPQRIAGLIQYIAIHSEVS